VGKLPFRTTSIHAFLYDLTTAPEEQIRERFERDLPPQFRGVFARALMRNRAERTSSMEELKEDLESALRRSARSAPVTAKASGDGSRVRSRILLALGVVGLLAFLLPMGSTPPPAPPLDASITPSPSSTPSTTPPSADETEVVARGRKLPAVPLEPKDVLPAPSETPAGSEASLAEPAADLSRSSFDSLSRAPSSRAEREEVVERVDPIPTPSPESAYGSLSITSDVWVEVRIDDGPPNETPVLLRGIPTGTHVLRIGRPRTLSRLMEVVVREGETTAIHLDNDDWR
jgi:hypothetical protein